jgi:tetratricopeptide (TPR) repeat protein
VVESDLQESIEEGIRLEQALRWPDAEAHYRHLLDTTEDAAPTDLVDLLLRHANSLLELGRFDEAQRRFDESLDAAKQAKSPLVLGRALLGAGVFAASRKDVARGEEFLLASLEQFHGAHDRDGVQGEGWALLNLAAIYGKTMRLDLAFLTFEKARERLFRIENWVGVATAWELQAKLRESLGDAARMEEDLHEAMSFYAKQGMAEKVEAIRTKLGGRRVV